MNLSLAVNTKSVPTSDVNNQNASNRQPNTGESRVPIMSFLNEPTQRILLDREVSNDHINHFQEAKKIYLRHLLNLVVQFIQNHVNPNYIFETIETMDCTLILEKLGKLTVYIMSHEKIVEKYKNYQRTDVKISLDVLLRLWNYSPTVQRNVSFSCSVHSDFCYKYYELFSSLRKRDVNFDCHSHQKNIPRLGVKISNAIDTLKHLMESKYYSLFRYLLDPNMDFSKKAKKYLAYLGFPHDYLKSLNQNLDIENILGKEIMKCENFQIISNTAYYACRLQIFIDVLIKAKKNAPMTLDNLKIMLVECKLCLDYYQQSVKFVQKTKSENSNSVIDWIEDFYSVNNYLKTLHKEILLIVEKESQKPQSAKQATPPRNPNKVIPPIVQNAVDPIAKIEQEIKNEDSAISSSESSGKKAVIEELAPKEIAKAPSPSQNHISLKDDVSDEDEDLKNVEREVSDLFESIRQMIESDRKKKVTLKEAKEKAKIEASKNKEPEILPIVIPQEGLKITLKNKRKKTLELLFGGQNLDRTISEKKVKSLITALNGHYEGEGNGYRFKIFWNTAEKGGRQAGVFEVIHGQDGKGWLKAGWAERVKGAILLGIQIGHIPESILPKESFA